MATSTAARRRGRRRPRRAGAPRALVLGGGFAGLAALTELPAHWQVTLVDRTQDFEFLPNIHELVSGVKSARLLQLPREPIVRDAGHRFLCDSVTGIDLQRRQVHLAQHRPCDYDVLIVALGGVNATHGVPGVAEHALPFKSVADCERIARRLRDLAKPRGREPIVIVGGGLEGVEALGEILRRWRSEEAFCIQLVEARDRLLPEAPASLDTHLRELVADWPVELHTGVGVAELSADAVGLADGRRLASSATLWTGGPAAPALLAESGLASREGDWADVDSTLRSCIAEQVFVVGDAALLPTPLARQAYHALDQGRWAARNAVRLLEGRSPRPFRAAPKPTLVSFGDLSGFLIASGHVLAGPPLAAAKEAVFELVMAQIDRRRLPVAGKAALGRLERAGRELLWPALRSPSDWLRQGRLRLLQGP